MKEYLSFVLLGALLGWGVPNNLPAPEAANTIDSSRNLM